ncbi:MAG TPA: hypothetical protein VIK91_00910 [Nannocystis sp.]|jgi:hypothetical protein
MSRNDTGRAPSSHAAAGRRPWSTPVLEALPRLEDLTLQSVIWGGEGGFSFVDGADPTRRLG